MKKSAAAVALTVVASLGLAACGSSDSGSTVSDDAPLQFVLSGDANQGGGYAAMAKEYEAQTGVKIEIVDVPYDDLATKVRNSALANDLPALGRMPAVDPVWLDSTVDLKEIAEADNVRTDLAAVDESGKVVSLPSDLTAVGLYLNKSLFKKAGVDYPTSVADSWTWTEMVAAVKKVQDKTKAKYGMVMDRSSHRLNSYLYEMGSQGFTQNDDGTWATNDQTKPALEYFKTLNDDKFMPRSVWLSDADPSALFKSGQVVAYYSGSWQIADFAKNIKDFDWVSVPTPAQPVKAVNYGTAASMVVFDGTGQEDKAVAFLKWLYAPENYAKLSVTSGFLPVVKDLKVDYTENADAFKLYNEEIAATPPFVAEQKQQALKLQVEGKALNGDPIREETIKYLNDEQDIDATIAAIVKRMNEDLS